MPSGLRDGSLRPYSRLSRPNNSNSNSSGDNNNKKKKEVSLQTRGNFKADLKRKNIRNVPGTERRLICRRGGDKVMSGRTGRKLRPI
jgi:hypothetical protein